MLSPLPIAGFSAALDCDSGYLLCHFYFCSSFRSSTRPPRVSPGLSVTRCCHCHCGKSLAMSFSSSGLGSSRRLRAPSAGSHSSPQRIPGSSDSVDGTSNATSDVNYGSFRAHQEGQSSMLSPPIASGQREPTRSSVHLSYRGVHRKATMNPNTLRSANGCM